jgi:uncharacterized membrane protein
MTSPPQKSTAVPTIATGGLIVGILDITSAFITWWCKGVEPVRGLQGIASGLLGSQSYQAGLATAGLGLAIHFFVAFMVVTVFYVGSRKFRFLTRHAVVSGLLYGVAVYLFMYWFVLPYVFPKFRHSISNDVLAIAVHMFLIGLPTALVVRRYSQRAMEQHR